MENRTLEFGPLFGNVKMIHSGLQNLIRSFDILKEGHDVLVQSQTETGLLDRMCGVIVDLGGYPFAWVGVPGNGKYKRIHPVAQAGDAKGYLNSIELTWSHVKTHKDPAGNAVQKRMLCIDNNLTQKKGLARWQQEASRRGFRASIAVPLIRDAKIFGALNVFASEPDAFDSEAVLLLSTLADDLSFGMAAIRMRDRMDKVEEELRQSQVRLQRTVEATVKALATTVEMRDPYTAGHQRRVAQLASAIAAEVGLSKEGIDNCKIAGLIHDIGKIYIPVEILSRPGRLTEYEISIIKAHPQYGHDIMLETEIPQPIADIIIEHHERINGTGYPNGKTGTEIRMESKILSVADVVEAMSSHRPYRAALGIDSALEEIKRFKGIFFEPAVVDACLSLFRKKSFELEQDDFTAWSN